MFKRIVIPLLIICFVLLVCPLSVFAEDIVPLNNFSGSFTVTCSFGGGTYNLYQSDKSTPYTFDYGSLFVPMLSGNRIESYNVTFTYHITVSSSSVFDMYLLSGAVYGVSGSPVFPDLPSPVTFSISQFPCTAPVFYTFSNNANQLQGLYYDHLFSFTTSSSSNYCYYFHDVPAGSYEFSFTSKSTSNTLEPKFGVFLYGSTSPDVPSDPLSPIPEPGGFGDVIDSYLSGDLTFLEAQSSIRQALASELSSGSLSDSESLFRVAYAQYELQTLAQYSDASLYYYGNTVFLNTLNGYLVEYLDGQIDLPTCVLSYSDAFHAALNQCSTSEEGTYINTLYANEMDYLKFLFSIEESEKPAKDPTPGIVDSDTQDRFDSALASEDEAIALFNQTEFDDAISFQSWSNSIDVVEFNLFSTFLSRILNDPGIGVFVSIPLTLTLVGIVLGTSIHSLGRSSGRKEKSDA